MSEMILVYWVLEYGLIVAEVFRKNRWPRWCGLKGLFSVMGFY